MKIHLVSTSACLNMFAVTCKGHDGETYILSTLFATRGMAEAKAELVRLRGSINPEHWVPLTKSKKAAQPQVPVQQGQHEARCCRTAQSRVARSPQPLGVGGFFFLALRPWVVDVLDLGT